jgi:anthranilate 1,2-dioxygenase ferredoxin component
MTTASDSSDWVRVCSISELPDQAGHKVELPNHPAVALFKLEDGVFAIADLCSHGAASLSEGFVENGAIECPFHSGTFDIRTGAAVNFPCTEPVRSYSVRVNGEDVEIQLGEAGA